MKKGEKDKLRAFRLKNFWLKSWLLTPEGSGTILRFYSVSAALFWARQTGIKKFELESVINSSRQGVEVH